MWEDGVENVNILECVGVKMNANLKQYIQLQVNIYELHGNYKSKTYSRYTKTREKGTEEYH